MKNKIVISDNSFFKKNWSWLLAVAITFTVLFVVMITAGITPFGEYSLLNYDCMNQYMPFFSEFRHKLINHENLFYSWNVGMGNDFYLIFIYYLTSPLNLLIVFFDTEYLCTIISVFICVKIILSAGTFGYFLSRREGEVNNKLSITAFSVAYALSGYICGYYWNVMWLDCIMVFPLIILGMNKLMTGKSSILYIVSLFFSMYCNFYMTFMICIFLCLWFFTYDFKNVKDVFVKGIKFALCSILSAGMSAFTLVVMFRGLFSGTSYKATVLTFDFYCSFAEILRSHYYMSRPIAVNPNPGYANVYVGVITLILALIYPFISKISRRVRVTKIIIALFMLVSMNITTLNYIWHGFHEQMGIPNRFAFLYAFVLLEMAYDTLDNIHHLSHARLIPGCVAAIVLPLGIYAFNDYDGFINPRAMLIVALIMSFTYVAFICVSALGEKYYYIMSKMLVICLLIEIISSSYVSLRFNNLNHTKPYMDSMMGFRDSVKYVDKCNNNNDFYREEVARHCISNESTFLNIKGTGTFNSTADRNFINTMAYMGYRVNDSLYYYYSDNPVSPVIDDIFGVRYIHSYTDEIDRDDYKLIYKDNNGAMVYENTDVLPLGYAVSKELIKSYLVIDYDAAYNQNTFLELSSGMEGPYTLVLPDVETYSDCCDISYDQENQFFFCTNISNTIGDGLYEAGASTIVEEDGEYYISIQNTYVRKLVILVNDKIVHNGGDYLGLLSLGQLKSGDKIDILMQIPINGGNNISIPFYMAKYNHDIEKNIISKLSENSFHVKEYTCNSLKGNISIKDNEMLFLSIPYSKGWDIYVDGKPSGFDKIAYGFIGVAMDPGEHEIEMKYNPDGLILGIIITLISWIIFLIIIVVTIINHKKAEISMTSEDNDNSEFQDDVNKDTEEKENGNNVEG